MKLFRVNVPFILHTLVAIVFCGHLSNALLAAAMLSELGILVDRGLKSGERSMASLGIFKSFILLLKSFVSFTYDGSFLQSTRDGNIDGSYIATCSMYVNLLS